MRFIRKVTDTKANARSFCLAGVLAIPLHVIKYMVPRNNLPINDLGLHLLYDPTSPFSSSSASPFCCFPISYPAFPRTPSTIQSKMGKFMSELMNTPKRPKIGVPWDPVHLTHVGFNSSTGEFTGLPRGWQQLLQESGISTYEQEKNPQAVIEIIKLLEQIPVRGCSLLHSHVSNTCSQGISESG